jgi:SAM-dependent methyltransferase
MSHESSLSEWPSGQLQAVPLCPVCHSAARTLLHEGLTDRVFYCAPGRWTLYRCSDCGSAYLDPRPSPASIGLAYARYYTHDEGGIQFSDLSPWCTRFPAWREGYLQQRFPAYRSQGPASAWGGRVLAQIGSARALLERDVRHLPTPGPAARLVDIGCGSGHFVRIAASLGYQAEGLEFDQQAVAAAQAQGIAVAQGALPDTWLDSAAFEAVTLSQVIEHLHDPLAALRDIARILKPGGFFWLATPNGQAHGLKRFGPHWRGLEPPRHLAVLSPTG